MKLLDKLTAWSEVWEVPLLPGSIDVEFSPRLRSSLGRCDPRRGIVRLNPALLEGPEALLIETLCHEAAHVAAFRLHGPGIRPHGPEWAALMRAVGMKPEVRIRHDRLPPALRRRAEHRVLYLHRCPSCGASRVARRAVRNWACRACVDAGLSGRLEIVTLPARGSGAP